MPELRSASRFNRYLGSRRKRGDGPKDEDRDALPSVRDARDASLHAGFAGDSALADLGVRCLHAPGTDVAEIMFRAEIRMGEILQDMNPRIQERDERGRYRGPTDVTTGKEDADVGASTGPG